MHIECTRYSLSFSFPPCLLLTVFYLTKLLFFFDTCIKYLYDIPKGTVINRGKAISETFSEKGLMSIGDIYIFTHLYTHGV